MPSNVCGDYSITTKYDEAKYIEVFGEPGQLPSRHHDDPNKHVVEATAPVSLTLLPPNALRDLLKRLASPLQEGGEARDEKRGEPE